VSAIDLPYRWQPRDYQRPAWDNWLSGGNRQLLVWHRRAGKDDINLRMHAVGAFNRVGTYWHMLPEFAQARKAIWDAVNPHSGKRRIDEAFPHEIRETTRETDMFIRFKSGSTFQLVGSDNYNALVGTPPVGLTASEWALANPTAWAYLSPILAENGGWASFISTPRGNNHLKSMYDRLKGDPKWFVQLLTVADTGAISDAAIEDQRKEYEALFGEEMAELLIDQEFNCSWSGAMVGAYWGTVIAAAEREGRIGAVPIDPKHPVHTAWDLGKAVNNPIWCFQVIAGKPRIVDFYRPESDDLEDWCKWLDDRGYHGNDYVPHDAMVANWGAKRTRYETLKALGRKPKVVQMVSVADGINAGRETIKVAEFDATRCDLGIDGLKAYRREWDDERKTFLPNPVKDWAEHIGSSFRYLALAWKDAAPVWAPPPKPKDPVYEARTDGTIMANVSVKEAIEAMARRRRARD
jgi:phage terminase large subunit